VSSSFLAGFFSSSLLRPRERDKMLSGAAFTAPLDIFVVSICLGNLASAEQADFSIAKLFGDHRSVFHSLARRFFSVIENAFESILKLKSNCFANCKQKIANSKKYFFD
jgi:hypothetical protein